MMSSAKHKLERGDFPVNVVCFWRNFTAALSTLVPYNFPHAYQINGQIHPRSLKFKKNIRGKPKIGVDLEEKQRRLKNNIVAFARRYFTPHEVQISSYPGVQHQHFVKLWTLKESYVKALGGGFSALPFKKFFHTIQESQEEGSCPSVKSHNEVVAWSVVAS
ncbi:hypothetical protein NL676_013405 [Syzygium grande]|nr:hypothetical protein NL676_013405 [Syzygium grande]